MNIVAEAFMKGVDVIDDLRKENAALRARVAEMEKKLSETRQAITDDIYESVGIEPLQENEE